MLFAFVTLGCKLNFAESSALGKTLMAHGHSRAKNCEEADVIVINTCSVTDTADHKDRQMIHRLRRQNPRAVLIVTGCYAQLKPDEIAHIEGVDYVLGQEEKFHLDEFVASFSGLPRPINVSPIREIDDFHFAYSKDDRTRCFLKVQDGCNYFCSYCTVPLARGKSRNPSIASLVEQAREALEGGAKEIILSGVNIGDFGRSTGETFIDLLKALDQLSIINHPSSIADYRIRISSCEPNLLSDEIIDFVAHSRHFAPHFHIPLQSGSNTVLKIMGRRYTRELFAERVAHIKSVMPNAFIGVDCMVGVRGETAECWAEYIDFIESLPVSQLHVFTYSERANTRMLEMDLEIVPQRERERRSKELHAISTRKTEAFYAAHKGETATVLWESAKKDGFMFGFTENYIKLSRPYDKFRVNTFEQVVI